MFPRWLLGAAVLATWGAAMGWRVQRDCLPRWREAAKASYRTELEGKLPLRERFSIGYRGRRVGELKREGQREMDGSILLRERITLEPEAILEAVPLLKWLDTGLDPKGEPVRIVVAISITPEYRLSGFTLHGRVGAFPIDGSGEMEEGGMRVLLDLGGAGQGITRKAFLPLDPEKPMLMGVSGLGALPELAPGKRWETTLLNPFTGKTESIQAELVGVEPLTIGQRRLRARRIEIRHAMGRMEVWVDDEGRLLRQRALGLELERLEND